ncbi:hypothetical protein [Flavobacterium hibisci]|uniref:hypothetical protein n=1 Tax=Flavobacterium hibisci TaxID=1914462 RepID=UPI001CC1B636|nr:hypothetical protein [Flavobacterium hibisci]MBZ4043742.1 hypothetical protein [Flavobacterium hibisci]
MSFIPTYGLLFEVTLLHNYFLNNGEENYSGMSAKDKEKMLQKFKIDSFAAITPTIETNILLRNFKMVFKPTKTGFKVYIMVKEDETDPFISIPEDTKLDFKLSIKNYQFENYTNLEFARKQIFLFSNVKPPTEPVSFEYIPKINNNVLISNDFLVSEETTDYLISELHTPEKQDIFGIISLRMRGDNNSKDILNNLGKRVSPNFKIHFDNRKTLWKYINRKAETEIITNTVKPLTYSGFVEIDPLTDFTPQEPASHQYPNPSVRSILKINSDYYSEIFI